MLQEGWKGIAEGGGVDFFVDENMYVGYGPMPAKFLRSISSNSLSVAGFTFSSHPSTGTFASTETYPRR